MGFRAERAASTLVHFDTLRYVTVCRLASDRIGHAQLRTVPDGRFHEPHFLMYDHGPGHTSSHVTRFAWGRGGNHYKRLALARSFLTQMRESPAAGPRFLACRAWPGRKGGGGSNRAELTGAKKYNIGSSCAPLVHMRCVQDRWRCCVTRSQPQSRFFSKNNKKNPKNSGPLY